MFDLFVSYRGVPLVFVLARQGDPTGSEPRSATLQASAETLAILRDDGELHAGLRFPPEILFHLRSLPGLWVVECQGAAAVREYPAAFAGRPPALIRAMVREDRSENDQRMLWASALDDGVLCHVRGIVPADAPRPGLPAAAVAFPRPSLALPSAHAGGLFTPFAVDFAVESLDTSAGERSWQDRDHEQSRIATAFQRLREVEWEGSNIGSGLAQVAAVRRLRVAFQDEAASPVHGYDPRGGRVVLPAGGPPDDDPVFLGAALYHAHCALTATGLVPRLAGMALGEPPAPAEAVARMLALQSAQAMILQARIAHHLERAGTFGWGELASHPLQELAAEILPAWQPLGDSLLTAAARGAAWRRPDSRIRLPVPELAPISEVAVGDMQIIELPDETIRIEYRAPLPTTPLGPVRLASGPEGYFSLRVTHEDAEVVLSPVPNSLQRFLRTARNLLILNVTAPAGGPRKAVLSPDNGPE